MNTNYENILYRERPTNVQHPRLSMQKHAEQFASVNMTPAPVGEPVEIKEYWSWDGDQTSFGWIE